MNLRQVVSAANLLRRSGLILPVRPLDYLRMAERAMRWGATLAAASEIAAFRAPEAVGIADDFGAVSWREVDAAANAVAYELSGLGVGPRTTVGLLCRNSRYFVEATLAVSKLGADLVLLNTDFGSHQLGDVLRREAVEALVLDEEFTAVLATSGFDGITLDSTAIGAAVSRTRSAPTAPGRPGRIVIMTSGTTGVPKGAQRATLTPPADMVLSAFSQLPLRAREAVVVTPPLFHLLGFGFLGFALGLQETLVVRSRFTPEDVLAAIATHRATTLVAVPAMLQRILRLPDEVRRGHDTSSLRLIVCSGSSLSPHLATSLMDEFGDILYNFYGSTETGWATVAGPADLREAPGTVGRPPEGTLVAILGEDDMPVAAGRHGRIFVGSDMNFEGYTGGGAKQVVGGLMSTGDVGHLDEEGRLFVEGRDDEMIVSGGENVFPVEVEELLRAHAAVADAAVVGAVDDDLGQRLVAFVVLEPGSVLTSGEVRDHVRSRLARFKVPRDVVFVEEIPRNAMGKVLRRDLGSRSGAEAESN